MLLQWFLGMLSPNLAFFWASSTPSWGFGHLITHDGFLLIFQKYHFLRKTSESGFREYTPLQQNYMSDEPLLSYTLCHFAMPVLLMETIPP